MATVSLSIGTLALEADAEDVVVLEPVPDNALATILEANFTLPLMFGIDGQSLDALDDEIAAEVIRLTTLLKSLGFLDAKIEISGAATQEDPLRFSPVPGPRYKIREIRVDGLPQQLGAGQLDAVEDLISETEGVTALQDALDKLGIGVIFALRQASYADAAMRDVAITLDRDAELADVVATVDPGLPLRFGGVAFRGSFRMDDSEAMALVPFQPGDPYSVTAIDALQSAIEQTGKFRRIRIEDEVDPDTPGVINLDVRLWDKAQTELDDSAPPWLIPTIAMMIFVESVRVTSFWWDGFVRALLIVPATLLIGLSALEVAIRVYEFLHF